MAAEYAENGGATPVALLGDAAHGPMIGRCAPASTTASSMTVTLDPAEQKFLDDHRIDGTPVLPGVMGMEAFAEAPRCSHPRATVSVRASKTFGSSPR
jgi:hypothetical protein